MYSDLKGVGTIVSPKEGDYREMPIFPLWTIYAGLGYTGAQTCKIT